jgi:hypothetical protein
MKTNKNNSYWRLEGDYFDGCNCKSICPCIFALDPTEGNCKGLAAWHIEKGHFTNGTTDGRNSNSNNNNKNNSINRANLSIILAVHAPGHMFTGPKWKIAVYLDERANNDQKDALTKIFTGQAGGEFFAEILPLIGEILDMENVKVKQSLQASMKKWSSNNLNNNSYNGEEVKY